MKLGLASDLHLDFHDANPEFFKWRGDVLLLAGDLAEDDKLRKYHSFFDGVSQMADHVLVIAGNHEYYGSEIDVADRHIDEYLTKWSNIKTLRNESVQIEHLDIFGATMWTDYHGSPIAEIEASMRLNDFKYIRKRSKGFGKITPRDISIENMRAQNALLNWLEVDNGGLKLVMTHHAPSLQSVPARYRMNFDLNKAYCGHFEGLIEAHPEIVAWVHGHTHDYFDYVIGETRILCNPRGYPNERPSTLPPYMPKDIIL